MTTLTGQLVRVDAIDVPVEYERKSSLVEDDALRRSIEAGGIQQPVVVFSKGEGRYALIDGGRRIEIARHLGLHTVPAVIDELPAGADPIDHQNRIRFILDEHRQDLFPSQRAMLINKLKASFKMTNKAVANYLGVDAGSITNWLAVDNYIEPIVRAIDRGETTMFHARAFDGMNPVGQEKVWNEQRKAMNTLPGGKFHRLIREKYPPFGNKDLYVSARGTMRRMAVTKIGRKARRRPRLSRDEKNMLAKDLDLKEVELEDGRAELLRLKREITISTQPIRGIMRSKALKDLIPAETLEELERFAEIYV